MTTEIAENRNVFIDDAEDRALSSALFDALRAASFDGVGITRESYSGRESAALDIMEAKARELGLETARDGGANLVVTLAGSEPDLPFLACGSHLDSVPQGGNFDGAAGVVAGLAVLARFKRDRIVPRRTIKLFGLRGEESSRFGKAYMGSLALFGKLTAEDLRVADRDGRTLGDCMRDVGADVARIGKGEPLLDAKRVAAWVELHIEQGPVLVARDLPVGIVTGIRGNVRHRVVECIGEAGHSGAVPRWLRHDAVFAVAELMTHLDRHWRTLLERGRDRGHHLGRFRNRSGGARDRPHSRKGVASASRSAARARKPSKASTICSARSAISSAKSAAWNSRFDRRLESAPATMDADWVGGCGMPRNRSACRTRKFRAAPGMTRRYSPMPASPAPWCSCATKTARIIRRKR